MSGRMIDILLTHCYRMEHSVKIMPVQFFLSIEVPLKRPEKIRFENSSLYHPDTGIPARRADACFSAGRPTFFSVAWMSSF
jgi:hypothetical protein